MKVKIVRQEDWMTLYVNGVEIFDDTNPDNIYGELFRDFFPDVEFKIEQLEDAHSGICSCRECQLANA